MRIERAPEVRVSDLETLILSKGEGERDKLVVVNGTVEAMSSLDAGMKKTLISQETGEVGVVLQRTQTYEYNERKDVSSGWILFLCSFFSLSSSPNKITSQRKVPFALVNSEPESKSASILVNLDGSSQQLLLDTSHHLIHPLKATPYAFLQAFLGHKYPFVMIEEEEMLLIGKEVYVVGICSSKDGVLEILSSEDCSYFLNWIKWKRRRSLRSLPLSNTTDDAYVEMKLLTYG